MKKKIILAILVVLVIAGGFAAYQVLKPAVSNKENRYFYIQTGEDIATVKKNLTQEKFISGKNFDMVCKLLRFKAVKPGRYKLQEGLSLFKMVRMLRSGAQAEVKLVILKERTKELFAGKFGKGKKFDTEPDSLAMFQFLSDNGRLKPFGVDSNTVLSVVMPYTYNIKWNSTPEKVFQQFYTAYQKFWTAERKAKADSLRLSPLQVISIASILEEETNRKDDKYNIASVYLNRVRTGMKLQADPTVKFAMKNFGLKRVTGVHLKTDSPYNTYMYHGIPPGPICTPSQESIDAVLDAPKTEYLFFVASHLFNGTSIFTTNLDDHMKYARLYQKELTRRMDSSARAKQKTP